jgi:hypothetical protein
VIAGTSSFYFSSCSDEDDGSITDGNSHGRSRSSVEMAVATETRRRVQQQR